jgi:hypothetical protein
MTLQSTRKNQQAQLETRQAQLFMIIYSQWNSQEYVQHYNEVQSHEITDFDEWESKFNSDLRYQTSFTVMNRFFEGVGVLVKRGLIDVSLVDDLMSGATMRWWENVGPMIVEGRVRWNWPQAVEYGEYLYNQIRPIVEEQHPEFKT